MRNASPLKSSYFSTQVPFGAACTIWSGSAAHTAFSCLKSMSRRQGSFKHWRCTQRRGILNRWQAISSRKFKRISRKRCAVQRSKDPPIGCTDDVQTSPQQIPFSPLIPACHWSRARSAPALLRRTGWPPAAPRLRRGLRAAYPPAGMPPAGSPPGKAPDPPPAR